jgi:hypothetical protein
MITKRALRAVAHTAAVGTMAVAAAFGTLGAAAAEQDDPTVQDAFNGCPHAAVCIYTVEGWYQGDPQHVYTAYGVHQFHNEFGARYAFNNQHSGATFSLCNDRAGEDCRPEQAPGRAFQTDLTPLNSIKLSPA